MGQLGQRKETIMQSAINDNSGDSIEAKIPLQEGTVRFHIPRQGLSDSSIAILNEWVDLLLKINKGTNIPIVHNRSVADLVASLSDDNEFISRFKQEVADRSISKDLFAMRCAEGLTQEKMAERLQCSRSKISKLEVSKNDSLRLADLIAYADALGFEFNVIFIRKSDSWP